MDKLESIDQWLKRKTVRIPPKDYKKRAPYVTFANMVKLKAGKNAMRKSKVFDELFEEFLQTGRISEEKL